jgi:hypothetical protein
MAEYIGLLKTASLFVAVLGFLLLGLSAFIVWKYDLLDYYRFKTGKGKKKAVDTKKPKTVSQYYSETLDESDSHEIINQEYGQDSSDLADNITIGRNAQGEVQQVIDNEVVDFTLKNRQSSIPLPEGTEETTLLGQNEDSTPKLYVDVSQGVAEEGYEAYEDDQGIDETDIIPLPKPKSSEIYENDANFDETDIMQIPQTDENEGSDETQLLNENLDETDAISIEPVAEVTNKESDDKEFDLHVRTKEAFLGRKLTAAELTLERLEFLSSTAPVAPKEEVVVSTPPQENVTPSDSDETELLQQKEGNEQTELDGSDETEVLTQPSQVQVFQEDDVTEDLAKEQESSAPDGEATTLFVDEEGEGETTVLSQPNKEPQLSTKLWGRQTTTFEVQRVVSAVVTGIKRKK